MLFTKIRRFPRFRPHPSSAALSSCAEWPSGFAQSAAAFAAPRDEGRTFSSLRKPSSPLEKWQAAYSEKSSDGTFSGDFSSSSSSCATDTFPNLSPPPPADEHVSPDVPAERRILRSPCP